VSPPAQPDESRGLELSLVPHPFDRVLRVSEKLDEKIAHVLDNPVRKGSVHSAEAYRWLWVEPALEASFARPGR
jgi:hypothetical protein